MFLSVTIDPARLKAIEDELKQFPAEANREMAKVINAAATEGRKLIGAQFFRQTTLQQKVLRRKISRSGPSATAYRLQAKIAVKGQPVALTQFKFTYDKDSKVGVMVQLTRSQSLDLPRAFVGIGPRGKPHILTRGGSRSRLTQAHYLPNLGKVRQSVQTAKGRTLIQLIEAEPTLLEKPLEQIGEVLMKKTADAIDRVLSRGGKGVTSRSIAGIQKQYA